MTNLCISYPKSGRTWLRFMLDRLGADFEYTHLDTGQDAQNVGKHLQRLWRSFESKPGDRVVFLHRDPRDTVTSFFHHMNNRVQLKSRPRNIYRYLARRMPPHDLAAFIRHPGYGIEKIVKFNLHWMERFSGDPNAMIVSYEDMRADAVDSLCRMLEFVGADVAREQVAEVVEAASFDKMRQIEARGEETGLGDLLRPGDPQDPNSYKVRKGKVGGFADEVGPESIAYFDQVLRRYSYFDRVAELTRRRALAS